MGMSSTVHSACLIVPGHPCGLAIFQSDILEILDHAPPLSDSALSLQELGLDFDPQLQPRRWLLLSHPEAPVLRVQGPLQIREITPGDLYALPHFLTETQPFSAALHYGGQLSALVLNPYALEPRPSSSLEEQS